MQPLLENIFPCTLSQDHFRDKKDFSSYSPIYRLLKTVIFSLNSIKTNVSDTSGSSLQTHVCTDVQKICFYWNRGEIISGTKHFLVPTPQFIDFQNSDIFIEFNKNDPIGDLWWVYSETRVHRLLENIFLLILEKDDFSKKKYL